MGVEDVPGSSYGKVAVDHTVAMQMTGPAPGPGSHTASHGARALVPIPGPGAYSPGKATQPPTLPPALLRTWGGSTMHFPLYVTLDSRILIGKGALPGQVHGV